MKTQARQEELERVVEGLARTSPLKEATVSARHFIESGQGLALFETLFKASGDSSEERMAGTMTVLERVIDVAPGVGAYLMARLYRVRSKAHHIRDSVNVWMSHLRSDDAALCLEKLAAELGPGGAAICREWVRSIRHNARHI
jgi:hypothetical protein